MQFITTGNRIAVENFTLGDLYTITFTNGTYINSACIGIGENFVSFQRNEPELLFSLTMATAELVSSIELYAGISDYDELTNKPQINGVELVGNKSLSDLGIQATISDLDTIRSGASAGATAVQPAALADYQPIIDSSNKLDADLVDDTTATHKFATAAQLSQIETNKNNISKCYTLDTGTVLTTETTDKDLNNYKTIGVYCTSLPSSNFTNVPPDADTTRGFRLLVMMDSRTNLCQIYDEFWTAKRWLRPCTAAGVYQSWVLINTDLSVIQGIEASSTNYIQINGIRLYFANSVPTGTIPTGSVGIGWGTGIHYYDGTAWS